LKAIITGGSGALGSSLTKMLLQKGYDIHIYDLVQQNRAHMLRDVMPDITYHWKSVHDMDSSDFKDAELVVYAAAQPDRPLGISSPIHTIYENIMGLTRVLEACKYTFTLKKFLYPGSGTTFTGVPDKELPVTESTIPKPTNPYSASKYMCEVLCDTYRRCYNIPTVILRSGLVFGEGMRLDISIAQFIMKSLNNQSICVRSPNATRTPTHIDDVMLYWNAIIDAEPEKIIGQIFHSVKGIEYSMIDIAKLVQEIVGGTGTIIEGDYEFGEIINGKPAREWTTSTKNNLLGIEPKIDLKEGINRTIPYIKEALNVR
jgi:nucleoside-diphosphate-sugar epimerase